MNGKDREFDEVQATSVAIGFIIALAFVAFTIIIKAFWELAPLGIVFGVMIYLFNLVIGFSFWKPNKELKE